MRAGQDLGAAERVLHGLAEEPGEDEAEGLVRAEVQELHRLLVHRVDEPHAVRELRAPTGDDIVELREFLGRHREVGVEDHEDVARGGGETEPHGVALAAAGLLHDFDLPFRVVAGDLLDPGPGVVARMALDKNDLGPGAELGGALDGRLDVAGLVAGGNHDGNGAGLRRRADGPGDDEDREAEPLEKWGQPAVEQRREQGNGHRQQQAALAADRIPAREEQEVEDVGGGEPAVLRLRGLQAQPAGEREQRPPEGILEIDDEPRAGVGRALQPLQQQLHIGGEVERVRDDDDVELLVQLEELAGLDMERGARHPPPGGFDLARGNVEAGFPRGVQPGKQFAGTAADFQDAGVGRHDQVVVVREQGAVAPGAPAQFRRSGVVEIPHPVEVAGGGGGQGASHDSRNKWGRRRNGIPYDFAWATVSHFVWFTLRSGWETKRCQTTAWKASLCGVMLFGFTVGMITQASATRAV